MARFEFGIGKFFETLTQAELNESLESYRALARAEERQRAWGKKYGRVTVTGQAAGSVLAMGGDYPNSGPGGTLVPAKQPLAGYAWAVFRASVSGLTSGTTPDVVALHRTTPGALYTGTSLSNGVWQFNGNNFAYTFSFGQMVFLEGETPVLTSVGTFASAARIVLSMDYQEVPQEQLYKVEG